MTLAQALDFMHPTPIPQARLGLERIQELMARLGDPQKQLHFIHVAGTNGKGSVCAMLAAVLQRAGYVTGLYTSPHLQTVHERMKVNGVNISDEELIELVREVKPAADRMEDSPTEFERITAMALVYFQKKGCDVVVLEVGLGGRLDSTNVIEAPDAAVITHIALEHTEYLGDTRAKIAGEKAGIIKEGAPVILYRQSEEVLQVVRQVCQDRRAPLTVTQPEQMALRSDSLDGQCFDYRDRADLRLALLGPYQLDNAAVVLDCVDVLNRERGYHIPERAVREGLEQVCWPGRFEVLMTRPLVIVDGAHNPDGVEQLARSVRTYLPGRKATFVMAVMADKDYRDMIRTVAPYARGFVAVAPDYGRALDAESLRSAMEEETGLPSLCGGSIRGGLRLAMQASAPEDAVVVFGSLYQVGEVRTYFGKGAC